MAETRRLKKSESLEIRIPHPTKQAFMARCQADGRSASEALRGFIEAQIAPRAPRTRLRYMVAGGLVAAALGANASTSLARPAESAAFAAIDVDGDGFIAGREIARLDRDHDGRISRAEFTTAAGRSGRP
jgi:hypothetical protein